ncbi:MAG: endonuclease [Bacteroidales bacterium]|nr:endonuclease [Bacteroidales bacterium]
MKNLFTTILVFIAFVSFSQIPDGYYDTAEDLNGEELKAALYNIIKGHTDYPYTDASTDTWDILKESDRDPDNSDNVLLIYTGESVNAAQEYNSGSGWSREHVWAKSHGFPDDWQDAYRDAHHLRPCDISVNSARGNKDFDNGGTQHSEATECYTDADSWEPRPVEKGDVARMMFYMATRYEGESGDPDLELVDYTGTSGPIFGKFSTLIQWNFEDPVDEFERNRNEVVFSYQGNRNPFIDHPEFVNAMYDIANSAPIIEDQEFTIAENSASSTVVDTVVARDPDYNVITFSIMSGNTDNAFEIDASTGLLTVNNSEALDYETTPSFNLSVEVSDGSLESSATITINLENTTGITPVTLSSEIKIYPNPAIDYINIDAPDNYSFEIYSVIGAKMLDTKNKQIDISYFDKGIYFVVIKNERGLTVKSQKIIKK